MTHLSPLSVPSPISFEDAIALTQSFLEQMQQGKLSDIEIEQITAKLVSSEKGARGFFVTYLTDDRPLADRPSPAVLRGLASAEDIVSELMVKNLAMSTAMGVAHRRRGDDRLAEQSDRTRDRSTEIIRSLQLSKLQQLVTSMQESLESESGNYQSFFERWGYDAEQKQAIARSLQALIGDSTS